MAWACCGTASVLAAMSLRANRIGRPRADLLKPKFQRAVQPVLRLLAKLAAWRSERRAAPHSTLAK